MQNSKVKPIEGNKLLLVRAGKKMPDLATMKISKYGAKTVFHILQCLTVRKNFVI